MLDHDVKYNRLMMDKDDKGRFLPGHKLSNPTYLPSDIRQMKTATKNELIRLAYTLLDAVEMPDPTTQTKLQFLLNKAVAASDYKFITFLLEQSVGKALQPIVRDSGDMEAKAIIRKLDGTIVEYSLKEKQD